jgi:transcriptional regulator with XRE-family HTH domain
MDMKEAKRLQAHQLKTIQSNLVVLIRHRRNKSIRNLSYVTGVNQITLSMIINGRGNPTLHTINLLSAYFKVDILQPVIIITNE